MIHGTNSGYGRHRCRCDECKAAHRRYMKRYQARTFLGRTRVAEIRTDAADVRAHLLALAESGWTGAELSRETGLSQAVLSELRTGRQQRTTAATKALILAVEPLEPDDGIDAVVVDRLVAGADWRALGATRAERIAAAEKAWAMWGPIRQAEAAQGTSSHNLPGESLADLERRLGLRAGRDFKRKAVAA
jgi:transcriptional regulator with XRE-family HTH domain